VFSAPLTLTSLTGATLAAGLGLVATFGTGVALRRRSPVVVMALAAGGLLIGNLLGSDVTAHVVSPVFVVIFVAYSAGAHLDGRRLAAALAAGAVLTSASILADPEQNGDAAFLFAPVFLIGAPMLFGQLLRNRVRLNEALRERARRDERGRAAEAEAAAQEERTRIAGELHDVVAHALSAMTVQATAARRLAARDPQRAGMAFAAVEGTGREALTELRRLLGVLRKEDEELALAPQPSLANVDGLARRATAAGLPVAVTVRGAARPLPAGVDLTAYRVVQEALNRAHDTGFAGRASVEVGYDDDHVSVEVRDDGAPEGRRLLGTRERVGVYGGELASAALAGGGWRVAARLPLEGAS
jgi:signal transduction histidine kinase